MEFKVTLPAKFNEDERIVLPVSMKQPLERGQYLSSILNTLRTNGYQSQTTILICDYLNRHNCQTDAEALAQGREFIHAHQEMLSGFKVIHWFDFIKKCGDKFTQALINVKSASAPGSRFYNKIVKTWEKCLSASQSLESSILYQQEEYAAIMCMSEFQHLIYPKRISNGMAYLYSQFMIQNPLYHHVKVAEQKLIKSPTEPDTIAPNKARHHVHIAFRALLEHAEYLLRSSELSDKSKKVFAEEMENMLLSHQLVSSEMPDMFNSDYDFTQQSESIN